MTAHSHSHSHTPKNYNRAFAIGVVLNIIFVVVEAIFGILSDSLALIADAGHNLSDVVSLLLAWGAAALATKAATDRRTYGYRKATVMASLASAVLLLTALGAIAWDAVGRFFDPKAVDGGTVIIVAAIGVVINTATALLFMRDSKHDLNIKGAFLHMAADAAVSLGVVFAGGVILFKEWLWLDPTVSLIIVLVVLIGTWGLLRDSMNYAMDAVPSDIALPEIRKWLLNLECVSRIHDLHVWPLSTTETSLTVHLVVENHRLDNRFLTDVQRQLHDRFGIEHATIQVESADGEHDCMLNDYNGSV